MKFLGEKKREGFETVLEIDGSDLTIVKAEAIGNDGKVLVSTEVVKSEVEVEKYVVHDDAPKLGVECRKGFIREAWGFLINQDL